MASRVASVVAKSSGDTAPATRARKPATSAPMRSKAARPSSVRAQAPGVPVTQPAVDQRAQPAAAAFEPRRQRAAVDRAGDRVEDHPVAPVEPVGLEQHVELAGEAGVHDAQPEAQRAPVRCRRGPESGVAVSAPSAPVPWVFSALVSGAPFVLSGFSSGVFIVKILSGRFRAVGAEAPVVCMS